MRGYCRDRGSLRRLQRYWCSGPGYRPDTTSWAHAVTAPVSTERRSVLFDELAACRGQPGHVLPNKHLRVGPGAGPDADRGDGHGRGHGGGEVGWDHFQYGGERPGLSMCLASRIAFSFPRP